MHASISDSGQPGEMETRYVLFADQLHLTVGFHLQCDLFGLIYCKSSASLIISAQRMIKINAVLLTKQCTEVAAAV